jgi:beta-aspartyl-dipeptidase (metallo-type)
MLSANNAIIVEFMMLKVLKTIECYAPKYLGTKDILIVGDKIQQISDPGSLEIPVEWVDVIDGSHRLACPGLIDGHVHIIGGGGEEGFPSRIIEIDYPDILLAGITTVVGLLGADHHTKNLHSLLAKAKALETKGLTTFIYTGSYAVPVVTLSGDIETDMILIDKVIGAGEIALSDHRSSHPSLQDLLVIASKVHRGGLIGGKTALLHFHLGDGKEGLSLFNRLVRESDLPMDMFLPTHMNRNRDLFAQAIDFAKAGGNIDLTSGEENGIALPDAVQKLIDSQVNLEQVTVSSDANCSIPGDGVGRSQTLFEDITACLTRKNLSPETVLPLVTENMAKRLKLYPQKGTLAAGSDADILILNKDYGIEMLFAKGNLVVDIGNVIS